MVQTRPLRRAAVPSHPLLDLPPEDNHTRLRVARQSYIPTPKSKLTEKLRDEVRCPVSPYDL